MPRPILGHLAALAILLAACTPIGAPLPPPAPLPETLPLPPIAAEEQVWRPGHWNWDGSGYRWIGGRYEPRTPTTNLWRGGVWERTPSGWTWLPPGWM